mmetsp:Transcript_32338/g.80091  ORF Transcript_32338/g.80091 Transcript_32338/m.80091 type:complete len:205 (+) Transcript_32338:350-964(+)
MSHFHLSVCLSLTAFGALVFLDLLAEESGHDGRQGDGGREPNGRLGLVQRVRYGKRARLVAECPDLNADLRQQCRHVHPDVDQVVVDHQAHQGQADGRNQIRAPILLEQLARRRPPAARLALLVAECSPEAVLEAVLLGCLVRRDLRLLLFLCLVLVDRHMEQAASRWLQVPSSAACISHSYLLGWRQLASAQEPRWRHVGMDG